MQSLHRVPLFFRFCLPIRRSDIRGGGGCVIRRLVLRGRCTLSPLPTGGNDAFSWRSREFGRKVSPVLARGEESLRRRKLFAGPDLAADFPVIASSSKALVIVSQNEQPIVERSYLTVVVLRRRSMKCSSNGSFYARLIFFFFFFFS